MRWLRVVQSWFQGDRLGQDIDDELAFHLEMRERELMEQGLSPEEARHAARRQFGNGTLVKEDSRAVWTVAWLETLWQDVRYGNRALMKSPGFTVVAVLTLALGIGASTVVFSIVNGVLLHPLGSVDHDGLVFVYSKSDRSYQFYPAWGDYSDWEKETRTLQSMAGWRIQRFVMAAEEDSEQVTSFRVTPDFFGMLGFRAALGRTFLAEDFEAGSPAVAVLTHAWWQRHLGGDREVIGRTLLFREGAHTIVGVLPDTEFQLSAHNRPDIFTPMRLTPAERRTRRSFWFGCVARLKPGVSLGQAQAELDVIAERIAQEYPDHNRGIGVRVVSVHDDLIGDVRPIVLTIFGAACFVLLLSCTNVANLLLARGAGRQREMAIRTAHGAGRRRIIRQLLTESVLLAAMGSVGGIFLAYVSLDPLLSAIPRNVPLPGIDNVGIDSAVLTFCIVAALLTGVGFGLTPAMVASRTVVNEALKESSRATSQGASTRRLHHSLVIAQVALSLVLLVGAGLMVQSFLHLQAVDPGFSTERVLAIQVRLRTNAEERRKFYRELLPRVRSLPGVLSAGTVTSLPLIQQRYLGPFAIEGQPAPREGEQPRAGLHLVHPDYFATMGIPFLRGRDFSERDGVDTPPTAIISNTLARHHWPSENPLGKRIRLDFDEEEPWRTVVGVVGDPKLKGLAAEPEPEIYTPAEERPSGYAYLTVRTASDPLTMTQVVQREVLSLRGEVRRTWTMNQVVDAAVWPLRFAIVLLGSFAALALLIAAAGVYAVMSYSVHQRWHEIGIRMALGASRRGVVGLVVGQGLRAAAVGVATGVAVTLLCNRTVADSLAQPPAGRGFNQWMTQGQRVFLYEISATDPATLVGVSLLLIGVAALACYVPARRATKVDPMVALRHE